MLTEALNLRLEVESEIGPWRVDLATELAEQLKAVLGPGLGELIAHEVVELGHDQPLEDVGFDVELKPELRWLLVLPLPGVGDRLVELKLSKSCSRYRSSRKRPLVHYQLKPIVPTKPSKSRLHFFQRATVGLGPSSASL